MCLGLWFFGWVKHEMYIHKLLPRAWKLTVIIIVWGVKININGQCLHFFSIFASNLR